MSSPDQHLTLRCAPPGWATSEIRIGRNVFEECATALAEAPDRSFVLVDRGIPLAAHPGLARLIQDHPRSHVLPFDGGEACKQVSGLERVFDALAAATIDRGGRLVVVGGGALGDLGGLAASLWLRGIELWQIPTTLLSMVDSSVGGKTAIDTKAGKNLVGSFWPAERVFVDPEFLQTLPSEEIHSGLGEVLKIAIGLDADLFELCEREIAAMKSGSIAPLQTAIEHCLRRKIKIVESDPTEKGRRRLLNLGHTLAHAIEAESGYGIRHGHAVARGLGHVTELASALGTLGEGARDRILACLASLTVQSSKLAMERALHWIRQDKKCVDGRLHAVLPIDIGVSETFGMTVESFLEPMRTIRDS
ncbi:MAG: 3-dehydroquinate synthase family protein [Planctomycetota bacterium]